MNNLNEILWAVWNKKLTVDKAEIYIRRLITPGPTFNFWLVFFFGGIVFLLVAFLIIMFI